MFTEIKELVNYIVPFLFNKIPRRKVITFAEQLANTLLFRLRDKWNDCNGDEMSRVVVIRLKVATHTGVKEQTDRDLLISAKAVGIDVEEMLKFLPEGVAIHIGPGEVLYQLTTGCSSSTHLIWSGNPDCDREYRPLPAVLSMSSEETEEGSVVTPDNYVPLKLAPVNCEKNLTKVETLFVALSRHPSEYSVEQFSVTRFGSHRARPDHEVMKRIQRQAAFEALTKSPILEGSCGEESILSENSSLLSSSSRILAPPPTPSPMDIIKSMNVDQRQMVMRLLSDARSGQNNVDGIISALSECSFGSISPVRPITSLHY
ncbi:hypothetical protein PMAYCL1PPCAC_23767 [Pristionchus mayeri]|uniref:Anti-proliferative protein domain-containing protein n=1 Tax=Pristionchus mayeri TaxID=1317129 RepID=A0AAN5D0V4_9BILA|nr:hypothetical protein PMAYCL1PPCAC_23767 [Pristionchus mayeri]